MIRLAVDCFGCDHPEEFTRGLAAALNRFEDVSVAAFGDEAKITEWLAGETFDRSRLEIVNASDVITNNDSPVDAIRHKRDSSLMKALMRLKTDGECQALISAGSTGAVLVGSIVLIGKADGVDRPGLAPILPCSSGQPVCICDSGANMDCKPEHLLQFAKFGSRYMASVYGKEAPTVGLLSVGVEEKKGNAMVKETHALLKDSGLNFIGNVEASEALSGRADVIVCDGFDGNVLVKGIEGAAGSVIGTMAALMKKNAPAGTDLSFMKQSIGEFMEIMHRSSMAGAVLLGVKKIVIKAHGNSREESLSYAIGQARSMILGGYLE